MQLPNLQRELFGGKRSNVIGKLAKVLYFVGNWLLVGGPNWLRRLSTQRCGSIQAWPCDQQKKGGEQNRSTKARNAKELGHRLKFTIWRAYV